jgi:hypothetical protein
LKERPRPIEFSLEKFDIDLGFAINLGFAIVCNFFPQSLFRDGVASTFSFPQKTFRIPLMAQPSSPALSSITHQSGSFKDGSHPSITKNPPVCPIF